MGPITGVRIVNLRVREKVAYADLTIDLAGARADHLVVGLENGGGKSTLLGAIFHVFVPEAEDFLPRRAQRRQNKKGEIKRLEHYVPGGDPTHFVIELEEPTARQARDRSSSRILIGACLSKPRGGPVGAEVHEYFWSARCVDPRLTLRDLGLRTETGRLRDENEFEAYVEGVRQSLPLSESKVVHQKGKWGLHLRSLGIDVDYVRQFLLRMNEDEGAADQVFTYASSRAFLNSLVDVVGNQQAVADLKKGLGSMAQDADGMSIERLRLGVFEALGPATSALSVAASELRATTKRRGRMLEQVLAIKADAEASALHAEARLKAAGQDRKRAEDELIEARGQYDKANANLVFGRVRLAEVELAATKKALAGTNDKRDKIRETEQAARAAQLLCEIRSIDARIEDIGIVLAQKSLDAEPLRKALASALLAFRLRIEEEIGRLVSFEQKSKESATASAEAIEKHLNAAARLAEELGRLTSEKESKLERSRVIAGAVAKAVTTQLIDHAGSDPRALATATKDRITAKRAVKEEHTRRREAYEAKLPALREAERVAIGRDVEAKGQLNAIELERVGATKQTRDLEKDIFAAGVVEQESVDLDVDLVSVQQGIRLASESARAVFAAVTGRIALASRVATALQDRSLLPPRPDIELLCDRMQKKRLGARAGWTYLAGLREEVASRYAQAHADLADGIVVNVPEDLQRVIEIVEAGRDELGGPVTIGLASAFETTTGSPSADVRTVLPRPAYWSKEAGARLLEWSLSRIEDLATEKSESETRVAALAALTARLEVWAAEIGTGWLSRMQGRVDDALQAESLSRAALEEAANAIRDAEAKIQEESRSHDLAARDEAESLRRLEKLEGLCEQFGERDALTRRLEALEVEITTASRERDEEDRLRAVAVAAQETSVAEQISCAGRLADHRSELRRVNALAGVAIRPDDVANESDSQRDVTTLVLQVEDRHKRWEGAISDPELKSELTTHASRRKQVEAQVEKFRQFLRVAQTLLDADPSRPVGYFEELAEGSRTQADSLSEQIGTLEANRRAADKRLLERRQEFDQLRRPAEPAVVDGVLNSPEDAQRLLEGLEARRETLSQERIGAETRRDARVRAEESAASNSQLIGSICQHLRAGSQRLAGAGPLVPEEDIAAREAAIAMAGAIEDTVLPAPLRALRVLLAPHLKEGEHDGGEVGADRFAAETASKDFVSDLDGLLFALRRSESASVTRLEAVEALLREAPEPVVRGDRLITLLRSATRTSLLDLAEKHERALAQRLEEVRHHVATFDHRIVALAETAFATVQDLLREVRTTVRESTLPNTPAMKRWAGSPLLVLNGLDALKVEEKKAALVRILRGWFNPESLDDRPKRFDNEEVVHQLLNAVTPQFTARILVPSDPLDPEHKPVDHLAMETSGGEGVTVALILASLLASRRAVARGHLRSVLLLDNPFSKVTKPEFLRLARDVANELRVQIIALTGIRDLGALAVFRRLTQLRVSRRENANYVVPAEMQDDRLRPLLRAGTLFVSPKELEADSAVGGAPWPLMSSVSVALRGDSKLP